ncbi:MAG: PAS domain-containing protein [Minwuia sp.]|uniref:PAS domain-containing protein n=1 Tax=Minwuia sp. TaxID=2493630 RepID=UPI003A87DBF0
MSLHESVITTSAGFDVIEQPLLKRFAEHWRACRPADGFPSRRQLDPTGFPWALPYIYILDRDEPPHHWRYRIAGSEIQAAFHRGNFRGLSLRDIISPEALPLVAQRWSPVADGLGVYMNGAIYSNSNNYRSGGRLLLPLSESLDRTMSGLVGISVQDRQAPAAGHQLSLNIHHIDLLPDD